MDKFVKFHILYTLSLGFLLINNSGHLGIPEKISIVLLLFIFSMLLTYMPSKIISTMDDFRMKRTNTTPTNFFTFGIKAVKVLLLFLFILTFIFTLMQTLIVLLSEKIIDIDGIIIGWMLLPVWISGIKGINKAINKLQTR